MQQNIYSLVSFCKKIFDIIFLVIETKTLFYYWQLLDYVKSLRIPEGFEKEIEELLENYEGDDLDDLMKKIYDCGDINLLLAIKSTKP